METIRSSSKKGIDTDNQEVLALKKAIAFQLNLA